jgi:hypothetical protein
MVEVVVHHPTAPHSGVLAESAAAAVEAVGTEKLTPVVVVVVLV